MMRYAVCCPVFEAEETSLTQSILARCEEKEAAAKKEAEAEVKKQQAN